MSFRVVLIPVTTCLQDPFFSSYLHSLGTLNFNEDTTQLLPSHLFQPISIPSSVTEPLKCLLQGFPVAPYAEIQVEDFHNPPCSLFLSLQTYSYSSLPAGSPSPTPLSFTGNSTSWCRPLALSEAPLSLSSQPISIRFCHSLS